MKQLVGAALMIAALFIFLGPPKKHLPEPPLTPSTANVEIVKKISEGERVELTDHLATGRYTVFAFSADW